MQYSPELRSFALTLQFYSTKAYSFVRKSFQLALPHPSQVRRWYSKVPAEPGFTEPAFQALNALVFMVVSLNDSWKVPIAYFLIDGLSGCERSNLVKVCVEKCHDVGVEIVSLTCDGPSCHVTMLSTLDAKIDITQMKPYFTHPSDITKIIYVLLDICHMLKLARNTLGKYNIILCEHLNALLSARRMEGRTFHCNVFF